MDNNVWIEKIVKMHFDGYKTEEAIEMVKAEKKEDELRKITEEWENKAKRAPVREVRGWKYQQPSFF